MRETSHLGGLVISVIAIAAAAVLVPPGASWRAATPARAATPMPPVASASGASPGTGAESTPQRPEITLDEAVRRALTVQPSMVQAKATSTNAAAAVRSAWGAYTPTVTASASAAKSNVRRIDPTTGLSVPAQFTYTTGLSAGVDLFDGFRRIAQNHAASAAAEAATAGLHGEEYQTTLATKQIFYNAAAEADLVRVAESQLTRAEQQFQVSVGKLRVGSATRADSLSTLVDVGNARIALLQAQANLATAEADLGRQVGSDEPVRAQADSLIPALPDTATLRSQALETAPSVVEAEANQRVAHAQLWSARSQYWPGLNLSYGSSRQDIGSPWATFDDTPINSWRFGLSWTIFNGFQREATVVQAHTAEDVAVAQAADARRALNANLTQQLAALTTDYAQIDIARANVAAAAEDFRVQNERYRVGASTIVDLTTAEAALTQAEVNLVQTRFNYLVSRAQVEAVTGRPLR